MCYQYPLRRDCFSLITVAAYGVETEWMKFPKSFPEAQAHRQSLRPCEGSLLVPSSAEHVPIPTAGAEQKEVGKRSVGKSHILCLDFFLKVTYTLCKISLSNYKIAG